jgi:hypothetical protein
MIMNNFYRYFIIASLAFLLVAPQQMLAGNKDRSGQAGASELLINPWARSTGWGNAGMSQIRGLEGIWSNVAGTAFTKKTELIFAHTNWLKGSDISIYSFGFSQSISEGSVLGLAVMSMNFGDIPITTTDYPDGGLGTFHPACSTSACRMQKLFPIVFMPALY